MVARLPGLKVVQVIVPLAGPDFVRECGSIKPLEVVQGEPVLKLALNSRPWAPRVKSYTFVLYDSEESRRFSHDYLDYWYPGCTIVYLSAYSRGAAMSALAGLAVLDKFSGPLIIDLADIVYNSDVDIVATLENDQNIGGIALTFRSDNPQYSYLARGRNGQIVFAAEKKVISDQASAGTYVFRNCATIVKAVAHAIENEASQVHNGMFYVCPLFNGVIASGQQVALASAYNVRDLKLTD